MKIVLASASPRRKELLGRIYDPFEIITADTDESLPQGTPPERGVAILACRKGRAVCERLAGDPAYADALVVSADTLVELSGEALGKPRDESDARAMLRRLSGNTHVVRTGVAVHYHGREAYDVATAAVTFYPLTDEQIDAYIRTGEPMDKAGAYGIQGEGGRFVASYRGDFDTIMGLSLALTEELIAKITKGDGV